MVGGIHSRNPKSLLFNQNTHRNPPTSSNASLLPNKGVKTEGPLKELRPKEIKENDDLNANTWKTVPLVKGGTKVYGLR